MDVADTLVDKIFSWLDLQKKSINQLNKMAAELEEHKKNINITQVVGSSVSVGGAVAMTAAGVATLVTGGAALPVLGTVGAVTSGLGLATNVGSEVVNAVISSNTMTKAKKISEQIENLEEGIQKNLNLLKQEGEKRETEANSSSDDYVVERILRAIAKRNGLQLHDGVRLHHAMSSLSKHTLSGTDTAVNLLRTAAPGLALLSKLLIQTVAKKSGKAVMSKLLPQLMAAAPQAAAKAAGRIGGGALGLVISLPELITNCKNLQHCTTKDSQQLRDSAGVIQNAADQLKKELDDIQKAFQRLATVKSSIENRNRSRDDKKTLIQFAMENCKDPAVLQWLRDNCEDFFKLVDMFRFLKEKIDKEEKKNHSNVVDMTFVAHGSISDDLIPANCLLPLPTIADVVLYSPWNCTLNANAAYAIATGKIKPHHRRFTSGGSRVTQPSDLPDHWNSMKEAGKRKVPNIMVSPLQSGDGAWKRFKSLIKEHGEPGRNRIVVPYILPEQTEASGDRVPFFVVTLALSLVLLFSRFKATVHLTACLGDRSIHNKFDPKVLKEQYAYTVDGTSMDAIVKIFKGDTDLYKALKALFG